jgi:hypothetical protein
VKYLSKIKEGYAIYFALQSGIIFCVIEGSLEKTDHKNLT